MTRTDWYGFHAHIDLIDGPDTLRAAWDDPTQSWYARRRLHALAASGALLAVGWNPVMHPRGRDGKFIEKFGWVRWLKDGKWQSGWVKDIDPHSGELTIRRGDGSNVYFPNAKTLYSKPKPKASLTLPNVISKIIPDKWKQVGGQGGSNPGAMFQIDGSFGDESADLSARSGLFDTLRALSSPNMKPRTVQSFDTVSQPATGFVPNDVNLMMVPRVDGTKGRYDMLVKAQGSWYRVPQSGSMTVDDLFRPELKVDPADAFGEPGTERRYRVLTDLGSHGTLSADEFDAEDVAQMVQATASPLPQVGDKYYVKTMNLPERARNEAMANDFYEMLGIPVPEVAVGADGKTISSKVVGDTVPFDPDNPAHVKAAQNGFVADAWLANWDVIGLEFDNIQIDSDGNAWRIDAGGAMAWRAMGKPKGAMFGDTVGELDSLRDPTINKNSTKVYGGISQSHLGAQAEVLQTITPAQIQGLADFHDLPELGPIMIARRKSILDQLGIQDPPAVDLPEPAPSGPTIVFNPVEAVQQMGKPPTAAVDSWRKLMGLQTTSTMADFDTDLNQNALSTLVLPRNDDLWVFDSEYEKDNGSHKFLARNLFTGQKRRMTLFDGSDQPYLLDYDAANSEALGDLVAGMQPLRDLAIAEYVNRYANTPLAQIPWGLDGNDPGNLNYTQTGITSFGNLLMAGDEGRLGPADARWPLRHGDGTLWDITNMPANESEEMVLVRRTAGGDEPDLATRHVGGFPDTFKQSGPWFMPSNDATAAVWRSKFDPPPDTEINSPDTAQAIAAKDQDIDDILALLEPDGKPELDQPGGDDGISDMVGLPAAPEPAGFVKSDPSTWHLVSDDEFNAAFNEADVTEQALIDAEQALATRMVAAEATGPSVKITNDVVDGLSAGTPILSTEMAVTDIDLLNEQLLNKPVVILPIEAHDNPDWVSTDLGKSNGLGTVTLVTTKQGWIPGTAGVKGHYDDVVAVQVSWANGGYTWVVGGEGSGWKKTVIPVETPAIPQQVVFKQNGDIVINSVKVGTWWKGYSDAAYASPMPSYSKGGVIDGDHSLNGKPLHFSMGSQKDGKAAASHLVVPIVPKPTKPKSTKIHATEDEIKKLNDDLLKVETAIALTEADLEAVANATPPTGKPLADGSHPAKGDWVFSTKDGVWAQVKQTELKFGEKHKQNPADFLRVAIPVPQPDGTTKWKSTLRSRNTLVSGAGPDSGTTPFVLQTKALMTPSGDWIGPGVQVAWSGGSTVLDTTTDGKVKLLYPDGSQGWVPVSKIPYALKPTQLKAAPGELDATKVDILNAELAALNDSHAQLAATIANTVLAKPKKKKDIGVPYPGPAGATFKQPAWLAEQREAKGLKNMKDGYVPMPGMILRHNDGTQYVVAEKGDEWSSHKNSVYVVPVGSTWDYKWRALSTMVVDHDAMLTDKDGAPLPIISQFDGLDWSPPVSGLLLRKTFEKGWYQKDPVSGQSMYRKKEIARFYIVGYDGTVYNLDGGVASTSAIQPGQPVERIGYIDKDHPGGKKLTASIQSHTNLGEVQYAVIHDPGTSAGITLAKPKTVPPTDAPSATPITPAAPDIPEPAPPPPTPAPPSTPAPSGTIPTGDLPVFAGANPQSTELPHPPTTTSSAGVPTFKATGGTKIDVTPPVAGAKSIMGAFQSTVDEIQANKQRSKEQQRWASRMGLGDSDVVEDMMFQTQMVRDAQGNEWVETRFRLNPTYAKKAGATFITASGGQMGDWAYLTRNPTDLVAGDAISVRLASGGGKVPKDALRLNGDPGQHLTPNATVTAKTLIGKNESGTYDVWRIEVVTANGDTGWLDLEDRGTSSVSVGTWDPTKVRQTNGVKGLNPNAQNEGWSIKHHDIGYSRAGSGNSEQYDDTAKKLSTGSLAEVGGSGYVLQRNYEGAQIEYTTATTGINTLDGVTVIRVPVGDPDGQRKLSEAMEMVGLTVEAQQPPDQEKLARMALNKVWQQFRPVYVRGETSNATLANPDEALDMVQKALGSHLGGHKVTLDDISLKVHPDGRLQVLLSTVIADAIAKSNGATAYKHRIAINKSNPSSLAQEMGQTMFTGKTTGLMSSYERFSHGLFYHGWSSTSDHSYESANTVFMRAIKGSSNISGTNGNPHLVSHHHAVHRQVDHYFQNGDSMGARDSSGNNKAWLTMSSLSGSNELMMSRRMETDLMAFYVIEEPYRTQLLDYVKKHSGSATAPNGKLWDDFIVTSANTGKVTPPPIDPNEVPLSAIAGGVPAVMAAA